MPELDTSHPRYSDLAFVEHFDEELGNPLKPPTSPYGAGFAQEAAQTATSGNIGSGFASNPQGLSTDGTFDFVTCKSHLYKLNSSGTIVDSNTSPLSSLPAGSDHLGGTAYVSGQLFIASSDYTSPDVNEDNVIAVFDTTAGLPYNTHYSVESVLGANVAIAGVGYDADLGLLLTVAFEDDPVEARKVHRFNTSGVHQSTLELEHAVTGAQSISWHDGRIFIGQGLSTSAWKPRVYVFDSTTGAHLYTLYLNVTSNAYLQGVDAIDDGASGTTLRALTYGTVTATQIREFDGTPTISPDHSNGVLSLDKNTGDLWIMGQKLPESGTLFVRTAPRTLFNFNTLWGTQEFPNHWEAWAYGDGRWGARVNSAGAAIETTGSAQVGVQQSHCMTWEKSGANVTVKMYIDGVQKDVDEVDTFIEPDITGLVFGGFGASNDKGDHDLSTIALFTAVLPVDEVLSLHNDDTQLLASESSDIPITPALSSGLARNLTRALA